MDKRLALATFVAIIIAPLVSHGQQSPAVSVPTASGAGDARITELIRQLGDPLFARRQEASRELKAIGPAAKVALTKALSHPDAEISLRAQRILIHVLEKDFNARLEAFAAEADVKKSYDLPCWEMYRKIAGDSPAARQLFAEALRSEPVLLETVQQDPRAAAEAIARRCDMLSGDSYRTRVRQPTSRYETTRVAAPRMAALLLAASCPEIPLDEQVGQKVFSLFHQSRLVDEISETGVDQPARRLLGAWIKRASQTYLAFQGVWLAMRYELKEGLEPAINLLKQKEQQLYIRQMAILAIGKLGSREHVSCLEPVLTDSTQCEPGPTEETTSFRCEMRDVALAVTIHLHGRNPKDFGFEKIQRHSQTLFNYNSMGFAGPQQRAKARALWKEESGKSPPEKPKVAGTPRVP